ncbi:unnamed protein product, partial [Ilex paraguariensis]
YMYMSHTIPPSPYFVSFSLDSVLKVLLGERLECDVDKIIPSRAGLQTVLEVLKIQMNYWPTLESSFSKLLSKWGPYTFLNRKKQTKKRRRTVVPIWWKWGRKRLLYRILCEQLRLK